MAAVKTLYRRGGKEFLSETEMKENTMKFVINLHFCREEGGGTQGLWGGGGGGGWVGTLLSLKSHSALQ